MILSPRIRRLYNHLLYDALFICLRRNCKMCATLICIQMISHANSRYHRVYLLAITDGDTPPRTRKLLLIISLKNSGFTPTIRIAIAVIHCFLLLLIFGRILVGSVDSIWTMLENPSVCICVLRFLWPQSCDWYCWLHLHFWQSAPSLSWSHVHVHARLNLHPVTEGSLVVMSNMCVCVSVVHMWPWVVFHSVVIWTPNHLLIGLSVWCWFGGFFL